MGKNKNTVEAAALEWELEDIELPDQKPVDRVLVLTREPPSRKTQLMHAGVEEIRCIYCVRIRPIAGAEELGDGWICEDCLCEVEGTRWYGGQRSK
jgi:hypothetical protein